MSSAGGRTFGAILDQLCLHPPTGRAPYTNIELAQAVTALGGKLTQGYLSLLRKGDRDNPSLEVIEYLAAALGVSPAAFVGGRRERIGSESPRASFSAKLNHL